MASSPSPEIKLLLGMLEEAFHRPAWHGPNLRGAVRRVPIEQAVWRPGRGRHNIAEIVLHCAYWKYAARRRLLGEKRGSFPLKGSNWFPVEGKINDKQWGDGLRLLDEQHGLLRDAIASFPAKSLDAIPKGAKVSNRRLIYGIAMHDVYHAGQIRLIKSMHGG